MKRIRGIGVVLAVLVAMSACNPLRGPVVETRDDGEILGTLTISRGHYRVGELVEVSFTIENISGETAVLEREDGPVQDISLSTAHIERSWVEETGQIDAFRRISLQPGEKSTIEWELSDLKERDYSFGGMWWSGSRREFTVVAIASYGRTLR